MNDVVSIADEINAEHQLAFRKAREALEHARRAGELLLGVKDGLKHGEWLRWVEQYCRFTVRSAQSYMQIAERWAELQAKCATVAYLPLRDALETLRDARETPLVANGMPYAQISRDLYSTEWYTPAEYLAAARQALGALDLDPASCQEANETVQATRFYCADDDGLAMPWHGRVWLNPPYGDAAPKFVQRLLTEYSSARVEAAVVMLNSFSTTTRWFEPFWNATICFASRRIACYRPGGELGSTPANGSVFVYLGPRPSAFAEAFTEIGPVVRRWPESTAAMLEAAA